MIDFIEDQEVLRTNFHLASCVKYICRSPYKKDQLTDLKKARWYLDRYIQTLEHDLPPCEETDQHE